MFIHFFRSRDRFVSATMFILLLAMTSSCSQNLYEEEGYKHVNGIDHFFRIVGEGEPYVVLHGGPGMYHNELYPFFQEFAKDHQVIFYDQRGNGLSLIDDINSETFNVALLVDDLDRLRQEFGIERLNLVGHSWGGLLAMYYAVEHPNKVERLITISSAPVNTELLVASYRRQIGMYTEEQWAYLEQLWESEEYLAGNPDVHNEAMRLAEGTLFQDQAKVDDWMSAAAFNPVTARNTVALSDLARQIKLNIRIQDRLHKIDSPTLIVHCREDFIAPEAPILANELIDGSERVELTNCGHYPHVETPEQLFSSLERFIAETRGH